MATALDHVIDVARHGGEEIPAEGIPKPQLGRALKLDASIMRGKASSEIVCCNDRLYSHSSSTALIPDKVLLRLSVHILSMGYLEDGVLFFTKVTGDNNLGLGFDRKVVEVKDGEEDGKKAVINS